MLLIQFKADKKKIIAAALAAILLVAGVIAGVTGTAQSGDTATPDSARAEQPARRFLEENGLQPKELTRQRQITVPSAFNNTYENYNRLQRQSGFDLAPYKGKAALMLVFTLSGADADRGRPEHCFHQPENRRIQAFYRLRTDDDRRLHGG